MNQESLSILHSGKNYYSVSFGSVHEPDPSSHLSSVTFCDPSLLNQDIFSDFKQQNENDKRLLEEQDQLKKIQNELCQLGYSIFGNKAEKQSSILQTELDLIPEMNAHSTRSQAKDLDPLKRADALQNMHKKELSFLSESPYTDHKTHVEYEKKLIDKMVYTLKTIVLIKKYNPIEIKKIPELDTLRRFATSGDPQISNAAQRVLEELSEKCPIHEIPKFKKDEDEPDKEPQIYPMDESLTETTLNSDESSAKEITKFQEKLTPSSLKSFRALK